MSEVRHKFSIAMKDGSHRTLVAGRLEVGQSGELLIKEVYSSLMQTVDRTRAAIAPGEWLEWSIDNEP